MMKNFDDIVGQKGLVELMKGAVKNGTVSQGYLLSGEFRSGKEFVATIFANALQCEDKEHAPCGKCKACKLAAERNHPDIKYIAHDKPSTVGVEDIRRQVNDDVVIKPYIGPYKIYIIEEAEKMTPAAQNALLKTLEEPPEYVVIILLATSEEEMLQTIRSRCVCLSMKPVPDDELRRFLINEYRVPDYKADICVAFARGNLGQAKALSQNEDFDKIKNQAVSLLKNITNMDGEDVNEAIHEVSKFRVNVDDFLDIIYIWYRDVLMFKSVNDINGLIFKPEFTDIKEMAKNLTYQEIEQIVEAVDTARARLKANVPFELTLRLLLLTIRENQR